MNQTDKNLWVGVLMTVAFAAAVTFGTAIAQGGDGVDSQERVIKLPNDQNKWHVSVVGQGDRYQEILGWFESGKLKELKSQVFFHAVTISDPIFARYKDNVKGLPTVRVQDADGVVIFEASKDLPISAGGLYSAISRKVNAEELLPWRRNHSKPVEPAPIDPSVPVDPEPSPLDDGGAPVLEPVFDWEGAAPIAVVVLFILGLIAGEIQKSKQYHKGDK
jgi:hypothetical protein